MAETNKSQKKIRKLESVDDLMDLDCCQSSLRGITLAGADSGKGVLKVFWGYSGSKTRPFSVRGSPILDCRTATNSQLASLPLL